MLRHCSDLLKAPARSRASSAKSDFESVCNKLLYTSLTEMHSVWKHRPMRWNRQNNTWLWSMRVPKCLPGSHCACTPQSPQGSSSYSFIFNVRMWDRNWSLISNHKTKRGFLNIYINVILNVNKISTKLNMMGVTSLYCPNSIVSPCLWGFSCRLHLL